ncbi:MAG: hypothetical protein SF162_05030 [bacterium]|nr:hypothetical protein [bacterium]
MMKWLRDTYNGVYVILLKPYMPSAKLVVTLLLGFFIGLIIAYAAFPTIYYDGDPRTLQQSWQDEWVKMLADRNAAANADIGPLITDLLARIDDPAGTVQRLIGSATDQREIDRLSNIQQYAQAAQPNAPAAPEPNAIGNLVPWLIIPIVMVIIFVVVTLLYGMFIEPNLVEPLIKRIRGERVSEEVLRMRQQVAAQREAEATQRTDFSTSNLGPPMFQRMSTYAVGMGEYDYSYSIETEAGAFLGECGVTGSETMGGDHFTAIEVWLFDKDDYTKTITKVLASAHAFNDPALRARLDTKGDVVMIQPNGTVLLETSALRLQARVVDFAYGPEGQPESYFQKITVELAAWRKDASSAPLPAAPAAISTPVTTPTAAVPQANFAPPPMPRTMPAPTQPIYDPPPLPPSMPASMPPPTANPYGNVPSQPPARRIDDDPFGGTAEFKP